MRQLSHWPNLDGLEQPQCIPGVLSVSLDVCPSFTIFRKLRLNATLFMSLARQIELEQRFLFLEELLNLIKLKSDIIAQLTVTFLLKPSIVLGSFDESPLSSCTRYHWCELWCGEMVTSHFAVKSTLISPLLLNNRQTLLPVFNNSCL